MTYDLCPKRDKIVTPSFKVLTSTQLNVNLRMQVKHLIVRICLSKLNTKLRHILLVLIYLQFRLGRL